MIRVALPEVQVERLELLQSTADSKLRPRVQNVLMTHRGRRHPDIAADTGTSHRSVTIWPNAYHDRE